MGHWGEIVGEELFGARNAQVPRCRKLSEPDAMKDGPMALEQYSFVVLRFALRWSLRHWAQYVPSPRPMHVGPCIC